MCNLSALKSSKISGQKNKILRIKGRKGKSTKYLYQTHLSHLVFEDFWMGMTLKGGVSIGGQRLQSIVFKNLVKRLGVDS